MSGRQPSNILLTCETLQHGRPHYCTREDSDTEDVNSLALVNTKLDWGVLLGVNNTSPTTVPSRKFYTEATDRLRISHRKHSDLCLPDVCLDTTKTMKTRVAIRDKSPHCFQVVPLRDARARDLNSSMHERAAHICAPKSLSALRRTAPGGISPSTSQECSTKLSESTSRSSHREHATTQTFSHTAEEMHARPQNARRNSAATDLLPTPDHSDFQQSGPTNDQVRTTQNRGLQSTINSQNSPWVPTTQHRYHRLHHRGDSTFRYQDFTPTNIDRRNIPETSYIRIHTRAPSIDNFCFLDLDDARNTAANATIPLTRSRPRTRTVSGLPGFVSTFNHKGPLKLHKPDMARRKIDVTRSSDLDDGSKRRAIYTTSIDEDNGVLNQLGDHSTSSNHTSSNQPSRPAPVGTEMKLPVIAPLRVTKKSGRATSAAIRATRRHALIPLDLNRYHNFIPSDNRLSMPPYYTSSSFATTPFSTFSLDWLALRDERKANSHHPIILDLFAVLDCTIEEWNSM